MRLLEQVPECAMVAAFLKAEYSSDRFSDELKRTMGELGVAESVIASPDVSDETANQVRADVLGEYRGYKQNREIFTDFPDDLTWYKAELVKPDIGSLRYVDYSYWNELTEGSRLVRDAVTNILRGKVVFGVGNDRFLSLAEAIRQGGEFGPLILTGESKNSPLTILEGHVRATALELAGDDGPGVIDAIVGLRSSGTSGP